MEKKKVLIIDDNSAILDSLSILLEDEGYIVKTRKNGKNLKQDISKFMPNLILLDIWLETESGIEIAKKLKTQENTAHIPIVLISAASNVKEKLPDSLADGFLAKPFEIETVLVTVNSYVTTR